MFFHTAVRAHLKDLLFGGVERQVADVQRRRKLQAVLELCLRSCKASISVLTDGWVEKLQPTAQFT